MVGIGILEFGIYYFKERRFGEFFINQPCETALGINREQRFELQGIPDQRFDLFTALLFETLQGRGHAPLSISVIEFIGRQTEYAA